MDLKDIYNEFQVNGLLQESIDFNEFVSVINDYEGVLLLRSDLIKHGYEVVDPITFFKETVNEIPWLEDNKFNKWRIFEYQGDTFLIIFKFSESYDSYSQRFYTINSDEVLEYLAEISNCQSFYSKDQNYLESLDTQFELILVDGIYKGITEPTLFRAFKGHLVDLFSSGLYRGAFEFVSNVKDLIRLTNYNLLSEQLSSMFEEYNVFSKVKVGVLNALKKDNFSEARSILSQNFKSLNEYSCEHLESLIEEDERMYQRAIEMRNQAELDKAQELLDSIARRRELEIDEMEHQRELFRLEEEDIRSEIENDRRKTEASIRREDIIADGVIQTNNELLEIEKAKLDELKRNNEFTHSKRKVWTCEKCAKQLYGEKIPYNLKCVQGGNCHFRYSYL
jgi:hypothetical protein